MSFIQSLKHRAKLVDAFKKAGIYRTFKTDSGERKVLPKIHNVPNSKYDYYVFTLPNGVDPKLLKKNFFVFQQIFGEGVSIDGEVKQFKLTVKQTKLIDKVDYDYNALAELISKEKIIMPIVCGMSEKGTLKIYDATNNPNLLIYGEPGSGKSSILHVINSTLIQYYSPKQIEFYFADFKMSELNVYEGVEHVKSVCYTTKELAPVLTHLQKEMSIRGNLLKQNKIRHINKLSDEQKPPYIVLCVDEFVMIRDDEIMSDLLQIASLGRAYGIYLILSMQRPSHKILSTDVRGLLSVRMGFRTVDKRNALIGETPGSETIPPKGYAGTFYLKYEDLELLRSPYLDEETTEKILQPYKRNDWKNHNYAKSKMVQIQQPQERVITESEVFNDVNQQG
jgi:S-DNA-T family DNA segregation ATPase FtsK/SpoIIIE